MRRLLTILIAAIAAWPTAHAAADCDPFYNRADFPQFTYYVLAFLNLNTSEMTPAARRDLRLKLEDRINPQLADLSRQLSERNGSRPRYVKLVACEGPLGSADLGSADLKALKPYDVIAAIWRGRDGLTYLTFPFYSSQPGVQREEAEVVLGYRNADTDPAISWAAVLDQGRSAHEAFVGLGLALVLSEQKEYVPAWITLCESRKALARAAVDAVRPPTDEMLKRIGGFIDREIQTVEAKVRGDTAASSFRPPPAVQNACKAPVDLSTP